MNGPAGDAMAQCEKTHETVDISKDVQGSGWRTIGAAVAFDQQFRGIQVMEDAVPVMLEEKLVVLQKKTRVILDAFNSANDRVFKILKLMRLVIAVINDAVEVSAGLEFIGRNTDVFGGFLPGKVVFAGNVAQSLGIKGAEQTGSE